MQNRTFEILARNDEYMILLSLENQILSAVIKQYWKNTANLEINTNNLGKNLCFYNTKIRISIVKIEKNFPILTIKFGFREEKTQNCSMIFPVLL